VADEVVRKLFFSPTTNNSRLGDHEGRHLFENEKKIYMTMMERPSRVLTTSLLYPCVRKTDATRI
jgi:hypothetical protein